MSCVTWCSYDGVIPVKRDPDSELVDWEIILATLSNWAHNNLLLAVEAETPYIPTQFYVAVMTTASDVNTPGTELTLGGYARVPISFERVSDIQRWNPSDVTTPAASVEWPTIASFTLWDDANVGGGNYWGFGNLAETFTVDSGDAIKWEANRVAIGLTASG